MITFKPKSPDKVTESDKSLSGYKIIPYLSIDSSLFGVWKDYPYWTLEDGTSIVFVTSGDSETIFVDELKEDLLFRIINNSPIDKIHIDTKDWYTKFISKDKILYHNTLCSSPYSYFESIHCEDSMGRYMSLGFNSDNDIKAMRILKNKGKDKLFRSGTYGVFFKDQLWKKIDVRFEIDYTICYRIGFEELRDTFLKGEFLKLYSTFIKNLFISQRAGKIKQAAHEVYLEFNKK